MPRREDEFPMLAEAGLYAAQTEGNGNCLFHALSDQVFGDQGRHLEIRARVARYMRANADLYKPYVSVNEGAGLRRNPKRKNAGAFSSSYRSSPPTQEQIDAHFDAFLAKMEKSGTYGDNLELNAFSNAYDVHVKIWHYEGYAWLSRTNTDAKGTRVVHVALHDYEHYSSVRNKDGPHSGLPNVKDAANHGVQDNAARAIDVDSATSNIELSPWKIRLVEKSLPYIADATLIQRTLFKYHGSTDEAINDLLGHESGSSGRASTPGSSSIEREPDSFDQEGNAGQRKKQDRRQSRATKLASRPSETMTIRPKAPASDAGSPPSRPKISPARARTIIVDDSESEEEDEAKLEKLSSSDSSAPSVGAPRLKLTQPKAQGHPKPTGKKPAAKQGSQSAISLPAANPCPSPSADAIIASKSPPTFPPPPPPPPPPRPAFATPPPSETSRKSGKSQQRQAGGGAKPRVSASAAKDLKKRAQKAASKERKQELAAAAAAGGGDGGDGGGGGSGSKPTSGKTLAAKTPNSNPTPTAAATVADKRIFPPTNHFGTLLI